jgi:hypothetical protein
MKSIYHTIEEDLTAIAELAKENYDIRNDGISTAVPGECVWHHKDSEIECKVTRMSNDKLRYSFKLNGKRISRPNLTSTLFAQGY